MTNISGYIWRGRRMQNVRMWELLTSGDAIDVRDYLKCMSDSGRYYVLNSFIEGPDYCDSENDSWIWSIGRNVHTREIHASTSADLYQNSDYECLFLR